MHHLFSTELNTLNFAFTFTSSTYSRVVDFGHYFSPKSTLRLIRESTRTRVYTVNTFLLAHRFSTYSLIWVLRLLSLRVKRILLAAPNRHGPLTVGGSHDRREP